MFKMECFFDAYSYHSRVLLLLAVFAMLFGKTQQSIVITHVAAIYRTLSDHSRNVNNRFEQFASF